MSDMSQILSSPWLTALYLFSDDCRFYTAVQVSFSGYQSIDQTKYPCLQPSCPFSCWEWGDDPKQWLKWTDKCVVDATYSLILKPGSGADMLSLLKNGGITGADKLVKE